MKRFLLAFIAVTVLFTGCNTAQISGELSVTPESLEFDAVGGTRQLSVAAVSSWTLQVTSGVEWCTPSRTDGNGSAKVNVTVAENDADARTAELVFSSEGVRPVKVTVAQAKKQDSEKPGGTDDTDIAKLSEGFTLTPDAPDADGPAKIYFKAGASSGLYNYTGEVYAHIGVADENDEWKCVPADWNKNTDKCRMEKEASNVWSLTLQPSIREWFNSGDMPVNAIAIIARSSDGSIKGINADTYLRGIVDTKYQGEVFTPDQVVKESMPSGMKHGINYGSSNSSVTFVLYDRDKNGVPHEYCYIVGDWNGWERVSEGAMKYDDAAGCWWITLGGFDADKEYRFQYRLGNTSGSDTFVSDPYTEIVYDQNEDKYIDWAPAFPEGAKSLVSAFQINRPAYSWKHSDFKVEDKNDLVIYEMHFRDFTKSQNIAGAMQQLDYIENLGVTAVQLMPIQEFDGNDSWGYNPNHWFALDKYYGTREEYKEFIDECHSRGIAVIVDVVYNHATGQHPWAKMWWSGNATASNNPFFNVSPTHPYNVYHDMNHENAIVKEHVKRSLEYLLTEYDVDGFRFDLTKGFTQKDTGGDNGDVAAWGRYDQSRVDILKGYADHIWSVNEDAVVIFEHLADGDEEKVLAEHGMQLWRNVNHDYRAAVAGGAGNFSSMYSNNPFGGFVGYMESHDEERLCYGAGQDASSVTWGVIGLGDDWDNDKKMSKDGVFFSVKNVTVAANDRFKIRKAGEWNDAYNYGASSENYKLTVGKGYVMTNGNGSKDMFVPAAGTYDIYFSHETETVWLMNAGSRPEDPAVAPAESEDPHVVAMRRAGASAAFFLTVPGPKMIWQFGEIGYDYTIEHNGRTGKKPVVTDEYMADPARKGLYDTYAALLAFRRANPRFFDKDAKFEWTPSATVKTITCSVDGKSFHVVGNFGKTSATYSVPAGSWTDYINGGTVSGSITLKQGEFRLLTNL